MDIVALVLCLSFHDLLRLFIDMFSGGQRAVETQSAAELDKAPVLKRQRLMEQPKSRTACKKGRKPEPSVVVIGRKRKKGRPPTLIKFDKDRTSSASASTNEKNENASVSKLSNRRPKEEVGGNGSGERARAGQRTKSFVHIAFVRIHHFYCIFAG